MKLKTLKEIGRCPDCTRKGEDITKNICCVDLIDLKQSGIEDIKKFNKNRSSNPNYSKQELNGIVKYIKQKFNIKAEDLKDGKEI